uniref:Eukaryotic translation initiation factor 3 subunit K n=1 Tax=Rhinopithecus roxellana TaxID=61622 RepID=A0A2K6NXU5_RHIRO
ISPFPSPPSDFMRASVGKLNNPEKLATLESYVEMQVKESAYDLEANPAVLKLYQCNPAFFQTTITAQIQLKALTNLPHTNFTLCKWMIGQAHQEECLFQAFWQALDENMDLLEGITGFEDSHIDRWLLAEMPGYLSDSQLKVWMRKYTWNADDQEENIKPKNLVEKIDFDSVSSIMASFQ